MVLMKCLSSSSFQGANAVSVHWAWSWAPCHQRKDGSRRGDGVGPAERGAELTEGFPVALAGALPAHAQFVGDPGDRDVFEEMELDQPALKRRQCLHRAADRRSGGVRDHVFLYLLVVHELVHEALLAAGALITGDQLVERNGGGSPAGPPLPPRAPME